MHVVVVAAHEEAIKPEIEVAVGVDADSEATLLQQVLAVVPEAEKLLIQLLPAELDAVAAVHVDNNTDIVAPALARIDNFAAADIAVADRRS
mmetsp:Transcript_11431/g.13033  ORF Transcript_11431/g.13033 Transcript_11431/m.13033 type:complete len:92 (+) Transcript_11431:1521-1796(+)